MVAQVEAEMDKYMGESTNTSGTPITSKITSTNVADHIGEYINLGTNLTDLATTGHKADWRIFDADETGVYAILSDYLPTANVPSTMKVSEASNAKEVTISKNENGWTIGWLNSGEGAVTEDADAPGTLLTASNWNFLVPPTSYLRGRITGTPTYQQFAKSWNKVNGNVEILNEEPTPHPSVLIDNTGMYVLSDSDKVGGMWFATPISVSYVYNVHKTYPFPQVYNGNDMFGIRPIAHLTSGIKVTGQNADGVWQIAQ